jgi:hypothetical protein
MYIFPINSAIKAKPCNAGFPLCDDKHEGRTLMNLTPQLYRLMGKTRENHYVSWDASFPKILAFMRLDNGNAQ